MSAVFENITVPTDGSTTAAVGVKFALELAAGGGRLNICSVVDPTLVCLPANQGLAIDPGPMLVMLDDNAALFCREAQAEATARGITATVEVLHGQCIESIEDLIQRNGSDAVVLGSHGRSGFARAVLGSVAEGLLTRSDVPVVVVHESDVLRTGPIAVAVDESPAAEVAVDVAIEVASARGMSLVLLHVTARHSERAQNIATLPALARATERARARNIPVSVVLREGKAVDELLEMADELECSMIVMGTHGRPLLTRLVLGSVAAGVLERAHVPVIAVRRRATSVRPSPAGLVHNSSRM